MALSETTVCYSLVPGTEYTILNAQNIHTSSGWRLLVKFRTTSSNQPHILFCEFHPIVNFLTDQQIEGINNNTLTLLATYFGLNRSGDPVFHLRDVDQHPPTYEELVEGGAFDV